MSCVVLYTKMHNGTATAQMKTLNFSLGDNNASTRKHLK